MICPLCSGETKVMDSRDSDHLVRRRRECSACRYRFSTHEAEESLLVTEEDLGQMIDQIQDIATKIQKLMVSRRKMRQKMGKVA
jgi:transcriptional regulator NrdR family protein